MSVRGEPIAEARARYESLVAGYIAQGKLGYAAHAIQDFFARAHRGFQVWDGKFFSGSGLAHILADMTASSGELKSAYGASVSMFRSVESKANESGKQGAENSGHDGGGEIQGVSQGACGSSLVTGCNDRNDPLPGSSGRQAVHGSSMQ